jgi:hypothetical protein
MGNVIDENAKDLADDVVKNPDNPRYKSFWNGDKVATDYVQDLYHRADPSRHETDNSTPEGWRNPPEQKAVGDQQQPAAEIQAEELTPQLQAALSPRRSNGNRAIAHSSASTAHTPIKVSPPSMTQRYSALIDILAMMSGARRRF